MKAFLRILIPGLALFVAAACGPARTKKTVNNNNTTNGTCSSGDTRCNSAGNAVEVCTNGEWTVENYCSDPTPFCHNSACVTCMPNTQFCIGDSVHQCNAEGTASTLVTTCDVQNGEVCAGGGCTSLCEVAENQDSYIGCEYWPTTTANPQLASAFNNDYGLVVHNDNDVPAQVTITKDGSTVAQESVPPGELKIIQVTFDLELKDAMTSGSVPGGAHHLVSSVPVTVYQFNPLNYKTPSDCNPDPLWGNCTFSHTNDASLLLPAHVLSTNYMIMARPTFGVDQGMGYSFIPGYFTVTATQDNTTVTVNFTGHTEPGGPVGNQAPGSSSQYQLNRGEVLQVLSQLPSGCSGGSTSGCDVHNCCEMPAAYDLTGTTIQSSAPVAVYSGHVCAFVPYNYWACDHLQQQMIPSEAWGREYVVAITEPQSPGAPEPNVIKVLSRENNNTISFYPSTAHPQVNLNAGEYVEFESTLDFQVVATQPTMVAQFTVGQNYYTDDYDYHGDPAFALVVPFEQYRDSYTFLVPETMTYNFVNIIAEVGEAGSGDPGIYLNGEPVSFAGAMPIGNTSYGVARIDLTNKPTNYHTVTGLRPFGIMVYGFASYTSYFYPGGLDLEYISPVL